MMENGFTLSLRAEPVPLLCTAGSRGARPGRASGAPSRTPHLHRDTLLRRSEWLPGWIDSAKHLKDSQQSLLDHMKNNLALVASRADRASCPTSPRPGSRE